MNNEAIHILYVEDDEYLGYVTRDNLELKGYHITHCSDGKQALHALETSSFDLCILDIMLPQMNGFELAAHIRSNDKNIPILFLTAKSMKEDRIKGFTLGGDDYITKPFSIEELLLRIEVFLKRSKVIRSDTEKDGCYEIGNYRFCPGDLKLNYNDKESKLTQRESELLAYLCKNSNKLLKRNTILIDVWGTDDYFNGRSLDVFISRIRKYLAGDESINLENVHGVGFIFKAEIINTDKKRI